MNNNFKNLTNDQLLSLLSEANWLDKELLKEYDDRKLDGRIPKGRPIPLDNLEEYIRNKYAERRKKAS